MKPGRSSDGSNLSLDYQPAIVRQAVLLDLRPTVTVSSVSNSTNGRAGASCPDMKHLEASTHSKSSSSSLVCPGQERRG